MKKLFLVVAAVAIGLSGCGKINDALDELDIRVTELESATIPTINEQIAAINTSIADLEAVDKELKGYITALQGTDSDLKESIVAINTRIDEVTKSLKEQIADTEAGVLGELATAKADVLAQLEALKTEINAEIATINTTIATLQTKDSELEGKIAELKSYVDIELKNTKDWASATFTTLEQYNALCADIATIKTQIESLNSSIANLESRLNEKIATDIATAVAGLQGNIATKATEVTEAYTAAIKSAKDEITTAYTSSIQSAISTLETSMKQWVNEQLANYYTIAEVDAAIATLSAEFEGKLSTQKTYLESLVSSMAETLTAKITSNEGLITELRNSLNSLSGEVAANAKAIANNAENISANATSIAKNAEAIVANGGDIAANKKAIETNAALIAENKRLIAEVETKIDNTNAANTKAIAENAKVIANNAELIAQNSVAISDNTSAIATNATEIAAIKTTITTTKTEITEAYTALINTSIETLNGRIDSSIATVNSRIDSSVATINTTIDGIKTRIDTLESDVATIKSTISSMQDEIRGMQENIANLLARIQSVSYIPRYTDNKAAMMFLGDTSRVELDFEVSPKDAVVEMAKVWSSALNIKAVYTETRMALFVDMPITLFESDSKTGIITISASGENLSQEFFAGTQSASLRLAISDGNNSVLSDYVQMVAKEYTAIDLSADDTSNCYIVPDTGCYKFNANVIGNGDKGIIPNVYFHTSSSKISPKSVEVIWDENQIVNNVTLSDDGYVTFYTNSNKGNALIAVKNDNNQILWSWHIWATDSPEELIFYNGDIVLDRNLGAICSFSSNMKEVQGLFYQWGRKDPFAQDGYDIVSVCSEVGTIEYTINNPNTFISGYDSRGIDNYRRGNWMMGDVLNEQLWGNADRKSSCTKTIYDPCPVGYKLPSVSTFENIYCNQSCDNGWWFNINENNQLSFFAYGYIEDDGIYYPNGDPEYDGAPLRGDYTSSCVYAYNNSLISDMAFGGELGNRVIKDNGMLRCNGLLVRCVKE